MLVELVGYPWYLRELWILKSGVDANRQIRQIQRPLLRKTSSFHSFDCPIFATWFISSIRFHVPIVVGDVSEVPTFMNQALVWWRKSNSWYVKQNETHIFRFNFHFWWWTSRHTCFKEINNWNVWWLGAVNGSLHLTITANEVGECGRNWLLNQGYGSKLSQYNQQIRPSPI